MQHDCHGNDLPVFDTTLCDKVCQWLEPGWWFSLGTPVSSTNKTEILLKVALNTKILTP
jgi:hypothetical protein